MVYARKLLPDGNLNTSRGVNLNFSLHLVSLYSCLFFWNCYCSLAKTLALFKLINNYSVLIILGFKNRIFVREHQNHYVNELFPGLTELSVLGYLDKSTTREILFM